MRSAFRLRRPATRKAQRGLTLLEIMIVIAILGLLVVIVVPRVMDALGESKESLAKVQVDEWKGYYNRWTAAGRGDKACSEVKLYEDIGKYVDKNMQKDELNDPFGKPVQLMCDDTGFKGVYSFGPNGNDEKGAGDDIKSWEKLQKK